KKIFEEAEVTIKLSSDLYTAWVAGGSQKTNITTTGSLNTLKITGDNAKLKNISFNPDEFGVMALQFNFLTEEITAKEEYTYYVTQKETATGNIIGGETYIIRKEPRSLCYANADNISANRNETVTLSVDEINEDAVYNWYDEENNLIYTGTDLTVIADMAKTYNVEIVADADGYKDYADVELSM